MPKSPTSQHSTLTIRATTFEQLVVVCLYRNGASGEHRETGMAPPVSQPTMNGDLAEGTRDVPFAQPSDLTGEKKIGVPGVFMLLFARAAAMGCGHSACDSSSVSDGHAGFAKGRCSVSILGR